tara:strand:- start:14558 stop:14773 length:216 start_codon:yes stop_codon:yes gene_type:complete
MIMKKITLTVPDQKVDFVMQLIKQLGLETSTEFEEIPEEHKAIVRERIRLSEQNPDRLLDWEEVKDSFKFD